MSEAQSVENAERHVACAERLVACLLAGDVDGVGEIYAQDVVTWRNLDGRELVRKQVMKIVEFLATGVTDLRYEDLRIEPTETGFVQQHTLCCLSSKGEAVTVPACIVARVEGGRITRIDEYMDSAAMAPLMG